MRFSAQASDFEGCGRSLDDEAGRATLTGEACILGFGAGDDAGACDKEAGFGRSVPPENDVDGGEASTASAGDLASAIDVAGN